MDGTAAIDHNLTALRRILASLVAMAGLATGAGLDPLPVLRAGGDRRTLPRHLYRAVLRLLRPAESAARRLIIALARGLVVALPPARQARPRKAKPTSFVRNGVGTGIVMPRALPGALRGTVAFLTQNGAAGPDTGGNKANCPLHPTGRLSFPLLDPLRQPFRRRRPVATSVPRICVPGYTAPFPIAVRQSPLPDDPIDAMRLGRRLAALALALDDLPAQARRFARWRARRDAAGAQDGKRRAQSPTRRISPLRFGRPPGGRLSRYDPTAAHPRNIREVDKILAHAHALALFALERHDTS